MDVRRPLCNKNLFVVLEDNSFIVFNLQVFDHDFVESRYKSLSHLQGNTDSCEKYQTFKLLNKRSTSFI